MDHLVRVERLAAAVRRSAEAHRDTLTARNGAVLEALDAGHSLGQLARAAQLSRGTVQGVIASAAITRQAPGV